MAVAQPNLKQGSSQASLWDSGSKTASGKKAGPAGVGESVTVDAHA